MCPEDVLKAKNVLRTPASVGRKCFRFNAACLKKSYSTSNLTFFLSFETKKKEKIFFKTKVLFPNKQFSNPTIVQTQVTVFEKFL